MSNYSPHQKGIIKRYYDNKETIMHNKLTELISDIYLCEDSKKAERKWKSVEKALLNMGVDKKLVQNLMADRCVEALAEVVSDLY
jgi:hypothetical protein